MLRAGDFRGVADCEEKHHGRRNGGGEQRVVSLLQGVGEPRRRQRSHDQQEHAIRCYEGEQACGCASARCAGQSRETPRLRVAQAGLQDQQGGHGGPVAVDEPERRQGDADGGAECMVVEKRRAGGHRPPRCRERNVLEKAAPQHGRDKDLRAAADSDDTCPQHRLVRRSSEIAGDEEGDGALQRHPPDVFVMQREPGDHGANRAGQQEERERPAAEERAEESRGRHAERGAGHRRPARAAKAAMGAESHRESGGRGDGALDRPAESNPCRKEERDRRRADCRLAGTKRPGQFANTGQPLHDLPDARLCEHRLPPSTGPAGARKRPFREREACSARQWIVAEISLR
jgi:hypothetical protein